MIEKGCIPPRFGSYKLSTFPGKQAQEALKALRKGKSIFLTGKAGTGKTGLAVPLLFEWEKGLYPGEEPSRSDDEKYGIWIERRDRWMKANGVFLPACEFFLELKQSFERNGEDEVLRGYSRPALLVLDDLGSERVSEWSRQSLYVLIDRRYRDCKQSIITSNLTLPELAEKFDDRIASRISEGVVIQMGDKDFRVEK